MVSVCPVPFSGVIVMTVVLLAFPDESACRRFADSPEYQEISRDRRAGADTLSLLVQGIPGG